MVVAAARERNNVLQSVALIGGIGTILVLAMSLVWGITGALVSGAAMAALYALAPRVPPETAMRLYRGTLVPRDQQSQLSSLLDVLAYRAGLSQRPKLYVIPSQTLNAFATGSPSHSAIAITEGLLRRLSLREIAGVLAHEISHIRNNDLQVMGMADIVTRFLQMLSYVALALAIMNVIGLFRGEQFVSWWTVLLLYIAPALSSLLQLGLSRTREFEADADAAELTGDAMGLASALRNLENYTGHFWEDLMFPVPTRRVPQPSLLRSHPTTEDRVQHLLAIKTSSPQDPLVIVERPMVSLAGLGPISMRPRYRWPGVWF